MTTAPAIPKCMKCNKQRVLYGGICGPCHEIEDREEGVRRDG